MNWPRAKTILIIAFIITDIFLIATYGGSGFSSEEFEDNKALIEFLSNKNIYLDEKTIPRVNGDMAVLFVQNADYDSEGARKLLDDTNRWRADGNSDEAFALIAGAFVNEAWSGISGAVLYGVERDGEFTRVIFKNTVQNVLIDNSQLVCVFRGAALVDYVYEWFNALRFHNNTQKTITAPEALLRFMARNSDKGDIYINNIEMVYWLDESVHIDMPISEDTAMPAWKISYGSGEFDYIDAFSHN